VVVLVGCDSDGAWIVVRRVHERMSATHDALGAAGQSQPKALYHFFLVHPQRPDGEPADENLFRRLFEEPPKFLANVP